MVRPAFALSHAMGSMGLYFNLGSTTGDRESKGIVIVLHRLDMNGGDVLLNRYRATQCTLSGCQTLIVPRSSVRLVPMMLASVLRIFRIPIRSGNCRWSLGTNESLFYRSLAWCWILPSLFFDITSLLHRHRLCILRVLTVHR